MKDQLHVEVHQTEDVNTIHFTFTPVELAIEFDEDE